MVRRLLLALLVCTSGCYIISVENARHVRAALEDRVRLQRDNVALRLGLDECENRGTQPMRVLVIQVPTNLLPDAGSPVESDAGEIQRHVRNTKSFLKTAM
jgi:hypothetical protein